MKLQKAVNGHGEVLHSAYGGSWVIRDPINRPREFAKGWCWITVAIGNDLGGVGEGGRVLRGRRENFNQAINSGH